MSRLKLAYWFFMYPVKPFLVLMYSLYFCVSVIFWDKMIVDTVSGFFFASVCLDAFVNEPAKAYLDNKYPPMMDLPREEVRSDLLLTQIASLFLIAIGWLCWVA